MKAIIFLLALLVISDFACADSTHVYECITNGEHVFSDHACADNAIERNVVVTSRTDSVKVHASPSTTRDLKRTHSSRTSNAQDTRRQRCAKIQKSRDALNDRMRSGFTARQDEKLHERLRKLDNDYYDLRCSSVQ